MAYYLDLFSPETYQAFTDSTQDISGFRLRQRNAAQKVKIGDKLICYVTRLSRWVGILEVTSKVFEDSTPRFYKVDDPFLVRFKVKPLVWLPYEYSIPIHDDHVWDTLTFTNNHQKNTSTWTGALRVSLRKINSGDGSFLEIYLNQQKSIEKANLFPLSDEDIQKIQPMKIKTQDNLEVSVSIPDDKQEEIYENGDASKKESKKMQALIAKIGERMGLKIWLPKNDRSRVLEYWQPDNNTLLEELPLNYDETTIRTIEQIDVIWFRRRSIIRAFEVEHTTSIYSGILRMADLMALQPNIDIHAHIVAPMDRKLKVLDEIKRPVFTLLEKGPLSRSCTFLSYDDLQEIDSQKFLEHMTDTVIDEYSVEAAEEY